MSQLVSWHLLMGGMQNFYRNKDEKSIHSHNLRIFLFIISPHLKRHPPYIRFVANVALSEPILRTVNGSCVHLHACGNTWRGIRTQKGKRERLLLY